jgi:GNAT superfamily N-acetyltransferase
VPGAVKARADFLRDTEGEALFVAVGNNGDPHGFISVWEPEAFIHHLYVRQDSRGRGVGGLLMEFVRDRIPMPWRLKCVRANARAIAFYLGRGWVEVGSGIGDEGPFALMERREA